MGSRRLRPMTAADLSALPEPCARCTFWESSLVDLAAPADHLDRRQVKTDWAEAVTRHWGYCGVLALAGRRRSSGICAWPRPVMCPGSARSRRPRSARTRRCCLSARVVEEWRGRGIGRQLVQSAAGLVVRRDIRALEAVGTYTDGPSCMLPTGWLEAVGFAVVRPHPITPRLRMDLQSRLRWADLGAAWHRLTGLVSAPAAPEPASYAQREAGSEPPDCPTRV